MVSTSASISGLEERAEELLVRWLSSLIGTDTHVVLR